jgi:hypothetical protein
MTRARKAPPETTAIQEVRVAIAKATDPVRMTLAEYDEFLLELREEVRTLIECREEEQREKE